MHNVEVLLVVTAPVRADPAATRFLLTRAPDGVLTLPCAPLPPDASTLQVAADLLKRLTGIEARVLGVGWLPLVQCPLADQAGRGAIGVPYGCMVPDGSQLRSLEAGAEWLTFGEVVRSQPLRGDHLDILTAVANYL